MLEVGRKVVIIAAVHLAVLFSLFVLSESWLCYGSTDATISGDWVEVISFSGSNSTQTELFTIDHADWRIRWEYDPGHWHFSDMHEFHVITYPEGSSLIVVDMISGTPGVNQNGTSYVDDGSGSYYMEISAGIIDSYTVVVEQNIESIPEFPSWVVLPLFLAATLVAICLGKRVHGV